MKDEQSKQVDADRLASLRAEYEQLLHAMQTGVAYDQAQGSQDGSPKHLRVGINSAMITDAAVAKLLIDRGVFSELEYTEAVVEEAKREVARYEKRLSERYGGAKISLG